MFDPFKQITSQPGPVTGRIDHNQTLRGHLWPRCVFNSNYHSRHKQCTIEAWWNMASPTQEAVCPVTSWASSQRPSAIAEGPKQAVGDDQETIAVARHCCWQVVANAWEKPPPHLFDHTYSFPTQAAFDLLVADTSKSSTILMSSDSTSFIFPYGHLCLRWGQACGKSGRRQRGHLGPKLRSLPLLGGRQAGLSRRYSGMSWMPCNHQWSYAISVCL